MADDTKRMNVLYSSDDNYAQHMGVSIYSLLRHNAEFENIRLYVIDNDISPENRDKLREMVSRFSNACVGLGAGKGFIETIINEGGYVWIAYGAIITLLPLLIVGIIGRYVYKLNYYTLIGVLSGATTNPPALAYSNDLTSCDAPAVGYATVYPLTMFLRVLTAQILILALA